MQPRQPFLRSDRVKELLKEQIAELLLREVEFDGALVTVIDVEVTKKLDYANVKFAVIPTQESERILKLLNARLPYLQSVLQRKIEIKPMPTLSFEIDKGAEKAAAIEKALLDEERKNG